MNKFVCPQNLSYYLAHDALQSMIIKWTNGQMLQVQHLKSYHKSGMKLIFDSCMKQVFAELFESHSDG